MVDGGFGGEFLPGFGDERHQEAIAIHSLGVPAVPHNAMRGDIRNMRKRREALYMKNLVATT
jgi:hypothetical protein